MNRHRGLMLSQGSPVQPKYLCFTSRSQSVSTVYLKKKGTLTKGQSFEYSRDDGSTWNSYTIGNAVTLREAGSTVYFRGENETFSEGGSNYLYFSFSDSIESSGDVTSLLNKIGGDVELKSYCFYRMFYDQYKSGYLLTSPDLPSTTLGDGCYNSMFQGCKNLTTAPELPASSLEQNCYKFMFQDCKSLTVVPKLPSIQLKTDCYSNMFAGCNSLYVSDTQTAEAQHDWKIPGNTVTEYIGLTMNNMFVGCLGTRSTDSPKFLFSQMTYYTQNEPV